MRMDAAQLRELLTERTATTPGNPERYREIEGRIRRIRRRRRAGAGVAAVAGVLVIAVTGFMVDAPATPGDSAGGGQATARPAATATARDLPAPTLSTPKPPKVVPAEEAWPGAVHSVPAKLSDGSEVTPVGFADDHTLVVTVNAGFETVGFVWRHDVRTGSPNVITQVPIPAALRAAQEGNHGINLPDDFTVGSGQVAWWLGYSGGGAFTVELWAAPVGGGQARRISSIRAAKGSGAESQLAIVGDRLVWSGSGEVYEAPLSGGPARRIAPAGFQLVTWPWVGIASGTPSAIARGGVVEGHPSYTNFAELRNLETGERRGGAGVAGQWSCGPLWCLGATGARDLLRRRDETKARVLPGVGRLREQSFVPILPALDRFVLREQDDGVIYVYDLVTGKAGRLGSIAGRDSFRVQGLPGTRIYSERFGKKLKVVNLAAIE